jgi:formate dehydrogenase major subunit
MRLNWGREVPTVCTFCGVGCGAIAHVQNGSVVNIEGDPDHPVNEGALCSKGSSMFALSRIYDSQGKPVPNPNRLTRPLYRAPGSDRWEVKSWDWMFSEIAGKIKKTRDDSFLASAGGVTVNRSPGLSWLGSALCTGEENYLFQKMCRALGIIDLDHCTRL